MTSRYPWEQWLDGCVWAVRSGIDFICLPSTIQAMAYLWCRKLSNGQMRVASHITVIPDVNAWDIVLIQAYEDGSTWRPNLCTFPHDRLRRTLSAYNPR